MATGTLLLLYAALSIIALVVLIARYRLNPFITITLVSLGEPRRMLVRARAPGSQAIALDLAPGSVLAMSHASQLTHEHGIPKTRRPVGERISVVFRVRP